MFAVGKVGISETAAFLLRIVSTTDVRMMSLSSLGSIVWRVL